MTLCVISFLVYISHEPTHANISFLSSMAQFNYINCRKFEILETTGRMCHLSHVMRNSVYAICQQQSADQPAHPHSLTSVFVVCFLESIIPLDAISDISKL